MISFSFGYIENLGATEKPKFDCIRFNQELTNFALCDGANSTPWGGHAAELTASALTSQLVNPQTNPEEALLESFSRANDLVLEKINNGYSDKITFFNHQDAVSVNDYHFHLMSQYRYIHGGCFFVPNNGTVDEFINDFLNYIDLFLEQGFVGSEEKYYDFCYSLKPHNYNIVKSDWRQYFNIFS